MLPLRFYSGRLKLMTKLVISFWLLVIALLLIPSAVLAQGTTSSSPTCDLCGLCSGGIKPVEWDRCHACVYDDSGNVKPGTYWTVVGCLSTKPELFVKSILSIVFAVSGGLAFLAFIGGSVMVLTSTGNPEKLNNGKSILVSSVFGLLLILFSVFLLRVVGLDILRIPGFG